MPLAKMKLPIWKRTMDLLLIVATAPITIPISLIICLYIRLVSSGSVLFKQERIGVGCEPFMCYKFRSMYENATTLLHQSHLHDVIENGKSMKKIDQTDPRLIPGAKWLRASGLDELPQLINVLKGEMSIVGPRPCLEYEFQFYKKSGHKRFEVLPGLTGLWQVSGKNNTTFKKMVMLDIFYAKRHSLLMDLKIILSTFPLLLSQLLKGF